MYVYVLIIRILILKTLSLGCIATIYGHSLSLKHCSAVIIVISSAINILVWAYVLSFNGSTLSVETKTLYYTIMNGMAVPRVWCHGIFNQAIVSTSFTSPHCIDVITRWVV